MLLWIPPSLRLLRAAPLRNPKTRQPWAVWLKEITLKDHAIDFEDRTLPTPAQVEVRALTVKTHDVRIPITEALPLEVGMQLNGAGTIHVNGSVLPNPFQADVALGAEGHCDQAVSAVL